MTGTADPTAVDGFILTGGQSRRMGRNKALIEIDGKPLLGHVIAALSQVTDRIVLVGNDPAPYAPFGLEVVPDRWPGAAALGGIGTALTHTTRPRAFVLACDLPFLTGALLGWLAALDPAADVTLPATDAEGPHPLIALYSRRCLPHIEERVAAHRLKVSGFFPAIAVRQVEQAELLRAGFAPRLLSNLNTPADLAAADGPAG